MIEKETKKVISALIIYYYAIYLLTNVLILLTQSSVLNVGFGDDLIEFTVLESIIIVKNIPLPILENDVLSDYKLSPSTYFLYIISAWLVYYIGIIIYFFNFNIKKFIKYFQIKMIKISKYIIFDKEIKIFNFQDTLIFVSIIMLVVNFVFFLFTSVCYYSLLYTFEYYNLSGLEYLLIVINVIFFYYIFKRNLNKFQLFIFKLLLFFLPKHEKLYIYDINAYYGLYHIEVGKFNYEIYNILVLKKNTLERDISLIAASSSMFNININIDTNVVIINQSQYEKYKSKKKELLYTMIRINTIHNKLKQLQQPKI